jgi:hypothetical protein
MTDGGGGAGGACTTTDDDECTIMDDAFEYSTNMSIVRVLNTRTNKWGFKCQGQLCFGRLIYV